MRKHDEFVHPYIDFCTYPINLHDHKLFQQDTILSFSHIFAENTHVGVSAPPTENPGSARVEIRFIYLL